MLIDVLHTTPPQFTSFRQMPILPIMKTPFNILASASFPIAKTTTK